MADFETHLATKGVTERHANESLSHIRKMIKSGRWCGAGDIAATDVTKYLDELHAKGRSAQTYTMMREDLAAAQRACIAKVEDDKEEHPRRQKSDFLAYCSHAGLYADFHSIRHTIITNLFKTDVSPKTAQSLTRDNQEDSLTVSSCDNFIR